MLATRSDARYTAHRGRSDAPGQIRRITGVDDVSPGAQARHERPQHTGAMRYALLLAPTVVTLVLGG